MKILCETQVVNRNTQSKTARVAKSTLAIGFRTANGAKELEILHFTPQNKTGVRYKVKNNIEKLFTKFILDGRATISFREPPNNLLIKCNPIELKGFLQTLKLGLEGKESINLRLNIAAATAIPQKSQPQQKMSVLKRSDYPAKGFPKTLKTLTVSGIQLCKITFDIISLRHLTCLDLSHNNIKKLPSEMGRLALRELRVNNNALGESNLWHWLQGNQLRAALKDLDLSANNLSSFPPSLVKLECLVTLKLNNNSIQRIPFGVRRLRNLRYLHMSENKLESLPSCFNHSRLELLDVWGNHFRPQIEHRPAVPPAPAANDAAAAVAGADFSAQHWRAVTPLWVLAARAVNQHKLPYTTETLPWLLVDILSESPNCACGKLCYAPTSVLERAELCIFNNVKNLVFSRERHIYTDIVFCGPACPGRRQMMVP